MSYENVMNAGTFIQTVAFCSQQSSTQLNNCGTFRNAFAPTKHQMKECLIFLSSEISIS